MSIRRRLLLALAALAAVGMWGLVAWLVDGLRPRYLESMEESMVDTAAILAETVAGRLPPDGSGPLAAVEGRGLGTVADVDLGALVDEVLAGLAGALAAKELRIERGGAAGAAGAGVRGDPVLLRQALANLVQNAIEFAPRGSAIAVEVAGGGPATVAIADRGPGIPDFARDKVFDRFYSLPRPDTGRKSTGLGLTFVREVAQLHRGEVALVPRPGGGAVATLRIAGCAPPP